MKIKLLIITVLACLFNGVYAFASDLSVEIGSYYRLGQYNGQPIIWRCVSTNDENGVLMVSDRILCFKAANIGKNVKENINSDSLYESNFWQESTIREWLNSGEEKIDWSNYVLDEKNLSYSYSEEGGFLSDNNFSKSEKSLLKTVYQWQALPMNKIQLSTNGSNVPYITSYSVQKNYGETELIGKVQLTDLSASYKGAMNRVNDTIFLLDEQQLYNAMNVLGTIGALVREKPITDVFSFNNYYSYWLRSPVNSINGNNNIGFNVVNGDIGIGGSISKEELGIRPAFYLNEATARIVSGSGTEDDPYVLDGEAQDGITVFTNAGQVDFDVEPITENDRTLVGMRAVFEALGADVEWEQDSNTAVATKDGITIRLQIDNDIMTKNGEEIQLDVPARIVNDRTMVPLRAISEALNARVDWIEDLQRVVIDVQPEWVESDWCPDWYKRALNAMGYSGE